MGTGDGFFKLVVRWRRIYAGPLGMVVMIIFWALIIGAVVKLFQVLFTSKAQRIMRSH